MEQEKPKETLKEKLIRIRDKLKYPALFILAIIPLLGMLQHYYSLAFPMLNLWDLFVEYLFGSFWLAVGFIILIFFVILMLGGISYYTVIIFIIYFLLAMTIGYGYPLVTVVIAIFGTMYAVYQTFKWWENR
jgi:hypothetical protein